MIVGLTGAGCGGGDSDAATASITKAEFVDKASAACARIHGKAQAEFDAYMEGQSPGTGSGLEELGKKFVIAPKQREVKEFVALGTPAESESQVRAIVVAFEKGIKEAEKDPAAVAQDSTAAFGVPEKLAAEYGLEGC